MTGHLDSSKSKYEFGRHGTFHLREGWLSKGISETEMSQGFDSSLETAYRLGLGSRMVKSLAFWMEATGLTEKIASEGKDRRQEIVLSEFGKKVRKLDPYFEFPMTLWTTHINLANRLGTVWNWFFCNYRQRYFDRESCIENFVRHVREHASNPAVMKTCQREVNCMLALYSRPSVGEMEDPEDVTVSPFRSLGLLIRSFDTGAFEKTSPMDRIPLESFLAAVSGMSPNDKIATVRMSELVAGRNSPGRLMNLDGDMVSELADQSVREYSKLSGGGVEISLLGAERVLRVPVKDPVEWLELHFKRIERISK